MCGIAGYFGKGNQEILEKMTRTLRHRGPDDEDFYINKNVGLGHRRLSIIDLSGGRQPMSDESLTVVFNGEIYNFKELRINLEAKGHTFKTNSDTEVILKSYAEYGSDCFAKFNGMFACALWDADKEALVLARDRLGKKPLYYAWQDNNFVFASELKAILSYPHLNFEIDKNNLEKYFFYDYIPCPHTPWHDVFKLEPASYLVFSGSKIKVKKYWQSSFDDEDIKFSDALEKFDSLLKQSVKYRLISDVPLGVFLSGGIDSSAVAWYASQLSSQKIKTFSIDFSEKTFGEGKYARAAASHIGSDHYEEVLLGKDMLGIIPKLAKNMDEPLADASLLPTYLLSEFSKQHVKVALGGDGADELLCGYQTFRAEKFYQTYKNTPEIFKKTAKQFSQSLPVSHKYFSLDFKIKKFLQAKKDTLERHQSWLSTFSPAEINFNKNFLDDLKNFAGKNDFSHWQKILAFYQRFYLQERVLVKVDRASMLASLEVRAPFLDYKLVEFLNNLPLEYKMRGLNQKFLLKKLMANRLPSGIINRRKKGFALPLAEWFFGPLKNMFSDMATKENIEKLGILDYTYISSLFENHLAKKENNGQKLWSVLMFLFWQEEFLSNKK